MNSELAMIFFAIISVFLPASFAAGFSSPPVFFIPKSKCRTSDVMLTSKRDRDDPNDTPPEDFDMQIHALNKIFAADTRKGIRSGPILTSARRRNLEREIDLLSQLDPDFLIKESLSAGVTESTIVAGLWEIWYSERGVSNERRLRAIEDVLVADGPSSWPAAEIEYLALIQEHCGAGDTESNQINLDLSVWVEPANRLATLLYIMGRFDESKLWCERILCTKPWHIGALSGIVLVCIKLNDEEGILKWAPQGLPILSQETIAARKAWVERNVSLAKQTLSDLKEMSRSHRRISGESFACTIDDTPSSNKITMQPDESSINGDAFWQ
ncbi:hypothetical protein ACHAW6_001829 [Cyclotella cf. meneghiniana]